ncbi:hypothetical protein [Opitutus terrae]|uniref:Tetratricopeptide TPR_4 n=1 Tax=Opitutus terrae (strain DSM 11246 / JCM 15787 / PB90-1) TaxID=452637 RepID=B1ZVM6_OPITP|nr:hypothetical protein [Opitutus terrae]ACB74123.1 Tetratricopeptide TPR_4 [Opitutus terrae PB90-1]
MTRARAGSLRCAVLTAAAVFSTTFVHAAITPLAEPELFAGAPRAWRDALQPDPSNSLAWQLAAEFLEQAEDSDAIEVRRQLVFNEPAVIAHRFALINTALHFGDLPAAQRTLLDLAALEPPSHEHAMAEAAVAFASNYSDVADERLTKELGRAADPTLLSSHQAMLRLRFGNRAEVPAARQELQQLLAARPGDRELQRELIADALRRGDADTALRLSAVAAQPAEAPFADVLLWANTQLLYRRQSFPAVCESLSVRAAARPADALLFTSWLIARGRADAADAWLDRLPDAERQAPELQQAHADCIAARGDWDRALPLIATGAWGPIDNGTVHRVLHEREIGPRRMDHAAWDQAIRAAAGNPDASRVLYRLAVAWGREPQRQAILLAQARRQPPGAWAFQALADHFRQNRNTARLQEVYSEWHQAAPDDLTVEGNLLLLTLLGSRRPTPEMRGHIDELSLQHPDHALLRTVRALALWQQGRADEARAITDNVRSIDRRQSPLAFYHGLFVAAAGGRVHEAEKYLLLSEPAVLLPEEEKLVRVARGLVARIAASE